MTRKDYELVAQVIRSFIDARPALEDSRAELALAFGLVLEGQSSRFDLTRFLLACGVDS